MKTIGIPFLPKSQGILELLNTIGKALNVRFKHQPLQDESEIDAYFILDADQETLRQLVFSKHPCFFAIRRDHLKSCGKSSSIELSGSDALPSVIRNRQIRTDEVTEIKALPEWLYDITILASKENEPVWAIHKFGSISHHYVSLPIPELNKGDSLFQYFYGKQFFNLLPFIVFLRSLIQDQGWEQPPIQACFMFDDPNLHWSTYGYINFEEVAKHAELNNYHVSFATIPLDAWFIHRPTAHLFKKHNKHISLLIHGNNHIARELSRSHLDKEYNIILRQALSRIAEFESRSDLQVARVLAPPHGACGENSLREMARLRFEAACISRGSLRRFNRKAEWLDILGMGSVDIINGLPVFPRFSLSQNSYNSILVAALLRQPIIPMGHHHDVSNGLQILSDLSQFINSLGVVKWSDMSQIARSHYARKFEGDTLCIKMFTKRIEILVPEGIYRLRINRSQLKLENSEPFKWRQLESRSKWNLETSAQTIGVQPGKRIELASDNIGSIDCNIKSASKPKIWPVIRRILTESRDRITPVLHRVTNLTAR